MRPGNRPTVAPTFKAAHLEKRPMMYTVRTCRFRTAAPACAAIVVAALASAALAPAAVAARDSITECSIAEADGESGQVWRYTINLQVPQGGHCRVYIVDDRDRKSWQYCWLKGEADNPVSATCDDAVDDPDFDVWKAKAACGGQLFMAYCHRETLLQPSH
jgi:hypothetical protein